MTDLDPQRRESLQKLAQKLGHIFHDYGHLDCSLTHCSYANEVGGDAVDNERYEFLGDAVLELVVTHLLCDYFPDLSEGELSKIRASSVNKKTLSRLARKLDLGSSLLLSRGERQSNGWEKSSILADSFEAVIGAIYLDGGLKAAFHFLSGHFLEIFSNLSSSKMIVIDYKTRLQEQSQAQYRLTPHYRLVEERGPDHAKEFVVDVHINGKISGQGIGPSKKEAEQRAARKALTTFHEGR